MHASAITLSGSVGEAFARTCARHGEKLALVDGDRRLTFSDLDGLSARVAGAFLAAGIRPGDVVAYQLPNWWEAVVVFLAGARLGAIVNPVLPIFRERELEFIVNQARPSVLVIPGAFRGCDHRALVAGLRARLSCPARIFVARAEPLADMHAFASLTDRPQGSTAEAPPVLPNPKPDSILLLMYTSGTTAAPKGVRHTHATLTAEVESLERVHGLTAADTTLMPSPLTHISGVIHAILTPALIGTTAVLMERWQATEALRLIARERVTYMVGAPTFLRDLTEEVARERYDLSSFRLFSCGGADVSAALIRRAREHLGCIAKRVYGSTEFPTITTTDAGDADRMGAHSEGRVIAPTELRVVGEDGRALPAGCEGEVQARGPECFVGYSDPALDAEAFTADGWFRTGDLGVMDAAGYLRITGRLKDIIIRKGEKFSVRELEERIARHPGVADVAVVAIPDPDTGERACAVVVLTPGATLTLAELGAFLSAQGLARQKLPERLEIVDTLPRTESGKVQRAELRRQLTVGS